MFLITVKAVLFLTKIDQIISSTKEFIV